MAKRIAVVAALLLAAVCIVAVARAKREPVLSVRIVGLRAMGGKYFSVEVLVTNHTRSAYQPLIGYLERWDGAAWSFCPDVLGAYSQPETLQPHASKIASYAFKHFPPGVRLRLVIAGAKIRGRIDLFLFKLWRRLVRGPFLPPDFTPPDVRAVCEFSEP
jgi:hypothetical protein